MSLDDQLAALERDHAALDAQLDAHPLRHELVVLQQRHAQVTAKLHRLERQLASYAAEQMPPPPRRAPAFSVPMIIGLSGSVALLLTFVLGFRQAPQFATAFVLALCAACLGGYLRGR